MKVTMLKNTFPLIALSLVATIALVGCSGGAAPKPENSVPPPPPPKTYSESDLVKILTAANTSLSAGGTVSDVGLLSNSPVKTDDLYKKIVANGGSLTPAACGTLFTKFVNDVGTIGSTSSAYAARLDYSGNILSATSAPNPIDVSKITALFSSDLDALSSQCETATISIKGLNEVLHFTKDSEKTDAETTFSYTENSSIDGLPVTVVAVIGVDGNLLTGFEGVNDATLADGDKAVDAVVEAAK
jgi:hypothetical protein